MKRWFAYWPAWVVLVPVVALAAWMLLRGAGDAPHERFGQLPVQYGGRVMPMDALARTTLLQLSGKDALSRQQPASLWLMRVLLDPRAAAGDKVFRVDHPQLVSLLGGAPDQQRFSLEALARQLPLLQQEFEALPEEAGLRTAYERDVAQLRERLSLYDTLAPTLLPPPLPPPLNLTAFELYPLIVQTAHALHHPEATPQADPETLRQAQVLLMQHFAGLAAQQAVGAAQAFPQAAAATDTDATQLRWESLGQVLVESVPTGRLPDAALHYAELAESWQGGDTAAVAAQLDALEALLIDNALTGTEKRKLSLETAFNTARPFALTMALYGLVLLVALLSWLWPARGVGRLAFALLILAFVLHSMGLGLRMVLNGRPPVTSLYSSALFVGWGAVGVCLLIETFWRRGLAILAAVPTGFATLVIASHLLKQEGDTLGPMRAVLDSNFWLATHVPIVTLGYSAAFLAGIFGGLYLLLERWRGDLRKPLLGMAYGTTCAALLLSFVGTVLGGIWADQSWGRFWGWDPKENGALMIVLWMAILLHARWGRVVSDRGLMQMAVFGNVITAWSWFGTNMLNVGLHSYGFTDAAFLWLSLFVGSQLLLIAWSAVHPAPKAAERPLPEAPARAAGATPPQQTPVPTQR